MSVKLTKPKDEPLGEKAVKDNAALKNSSVFSFPSHELPSKGAKIVESGDIHLPPAFWNLRREGISELPSETLVSKTFKWMSL